MTDEQVLAGCREVYPALFRHGLTGLPSDGTGTKQQMESTVKLVRRILAAAEKAAPANPA